MDDLPIEIIDRIFSYLTQSSILNMYDLGGKWQQSAQRILQRKALTISLSDVLPELSPHLKRFTWYVICIEIDTPDHKFVSKIFKQFPNLYMLKFKSENPHLHEGLDKFKEIHFCENFYINELMIARLLIQCSDRLNTLFVRGPCIDGTFLQAAPTSIKRLVLENGYHVKMRNVYNYLNKNHSLLSFMLEIDIGKIDLGRLLENLQFVEDLVLPGQSTKTGYAELANLTQLQHLQLLVSSPDFSDYPKALDDKAQQLIELIMMIETLTVTPDFAKSFEKFMHIRKLTIYIGTVVTGAHLLLPHINYLAKFACLESVLLSGYTNVLENVATHLPDVKNLRVCGPSCNCSLRHFRVEDRTNRTRIAYDQSKPLTFFAHNHTVFTDNCCEFHNPRKIRKTCRN